MENNKIKPQKQRNNQNRKKKNDKKDNTIRNIIIAIITILLLLIGIKSCSDNPSNPIGNIDFPTWNTDIGEDVGDISGKVSQDEIKEQLNQKVDENKINISMNLNPVFETGTSKGNLKIVNEKINNYMQVVEIYRDDTNELIYTSSAIPVGKQLSSAKLNVPLAKGEYNCTAYFNAIREDGTYVGKAAAKVKITVTK
jgi:hypothetical protein